jgi:hypothetical protein
LGRERVYRIRFQLIIAGESPIQADHLLGLGRSQLLD